MAKFYKCQSIFQYNDMVRQVKENHTFTHTELPTAVTFTGTVKVHGCNVGIGYNPVCGTIWVQSRNHILSEKKDMFDFHTFVMKNKEYFICILSTLSSKHPVVAYGEWFGHCIQKNVAVDSLQRRLMIFAVKVIDETVIPSKCIWLETEAVALFFHPPYLIFNVTNFTTYSIDVDFSHPLLAQNDLVDLTTSVEKECPVGKYFGVSGIGEGIVWHSPTYGRFKVKGMAHSSSLVTTLASVDTEKLATIEEFVKYAVTDNRLNQGIFQVFTIHGDKPDVKRTREFLNWIIADIFKEETVTLRENNLLPEQVSKMITNNARAWFVTSCKQIY